MSDPADPSSTPEPFQPYLPPPTAYTPTPIAPATRLAPPAAMITVRPPDRRARRGRRGALALALVMVLGAAGVGVWWATRSKDDAERYSLTAAASNAKAATNVAYEMTMTLPDLGTTTAKARLDISKHLIAMDLQVPTVGPVGAIMDPQAGMIYIDASELGAPAPTRYVSMSFDRFPGLTEVMQTNSTSNPLDVAAAFTAAKTTEDLGDETVDGVTYRHYRLTVDTAEQLAAYPLLRQAVEKAGTVMPTEITTDVWVTEDNQLHRVASSYPINGQQFSMDITYTAIGDDMEPVVVPDASDVTDISSLI